MRKSRYRKLEASRGDRIGVGFSLILLVALVLIVILQPAKAEAIWSQAPVIQSEQVAAAEAREQLQSELRSLVASWASAWQSQFDDVYLMHYHPAFQPEGFASLETWKSSMRRRVTTPDNINISLKGFELVETHDDIAVVRFSVNFSRSGYADQTRKEMQLRLHGHLWMIEREHNLQVTRLAASSR